MRIGVDEVGRGCIAGDLVVVAYAIKPDLSEDERTLLRATAMDSKAFSSKRRREDAACIVREAGIYAIARANPCEIDRVNIRQATLNAMRDASLEVFSKIGGGEILFDGRDVPDGMTGAVSAVIKGDASVLEISCASIVAKTLRDAEMVEQAQIYPGYGFDLHAGYGTKAHVEAIKVLGLCDIHRSWARKFVV
jgi:ribonuclease HII